MTVATETGRTKLEQAARRLEELVAERRELETLVAQAPAQEEQAAYEAVRQAPTQPVYGKVDSVVAKLRRNVSKARKRLESNATEQAALERFISEERTKAASEELREKTGRLNELAAGELAGWERLGEAYRAVLEAWMCGVVEIAETRDQFISETIQSGLPSIADAQTRAAWEEAMRPPVLPFPATTWIAIELLHQVIVDPTNAGYRYPDPVHRTRADSGHVLVGIWPDMRDQVRNPVLSGRVDRRHVVGG